MNGFADHRLNDDDFGETKALSVKAFDAFRKCLGTQTYLTHTRNGGVWTICLTLVCIYLVATEVWRWMLGTTSHAFSVEKGIAHDLQINLDIVVAMRCAELHINVQDASGDRVMAGETLSKDLTKWAMWPDKGTKGKTTSTDRSIRESVQWEQQQALQYGHKEDVHDYLGAARGRRRFAKTPKLRGGEQNSDSCRIYGSLESNKVQGDFHITARGHGYMEFGEHLDHKAFNFSHHINELSFGPFYPSLINPLDNTRSTVSAHFYKYQYYLSIVPTIYTDAPHELTSKSRFEQQSKEGRQFQPFRHTPHTIFTNQYAVTEQSHIVGESQIPGIFVKYDIEPILLTVAEEWGGLLGMSVRIVNVVAGVLVAGGWLVSLVDWAGDMIGNRGRARSGSGSGLLHGEKVARA